MTTTVSEDVRQFFEMCGSKRIELWSEDRNIDRVEARVSLEVLYHAISTRFAAEAGIEIPPDQSEGEHHAIVDEAPMSDEEMRDLIDQIDLPAPAVFARLRKKIIDRAGLGSVRNEKLGELVDYIDEDRKANERKIAKAAKSLREKNDGIEQLGRELCKASALAVRLEKNLDAARRESRAFQEKYRTVADAIGCRADPTRLGEGKIGEDMADVRARQVVALFDENARLRIELAKAQRDRDSALTGANDWMRRHAGVVDELATVIAFVRECEEMIRNPSTWGMRAKNVDLEAKREKLNRILQKERREPEPAAT